MSALSALDRNGNDRTLTFSLEGSPSPKKRSYPEENKMPSLILDQKPRDISRKRRTFSQVKPEPGKESASHRHTVKKIKSLHLAPLLGPAKTPSVQISFIHLPVRFVDLEELPQALSAAHLEPSDPKKEPTTPPSFSLNQYTLSAMQHTGAPAEKGVSSVATQQDQLRRMTIFATLSKKD